MNIFFSKKVIVMVLIFVMIEVLAGLPLPAKERRGATVEVTMSDGSKVKGELLAVKTDALLIYDPAGGQGKSLDLQQVVQVKIINNTKFGEGLLIGLGIGLVIGSDPEKNVHIESYWLKTIITFGLIGGILGAFSGIPEKFSLTKASYQNAQQNLKRLARYAREQDFEKPATTEFAIGQSATSDALSHPRHRQLHRFRLLWSPGQQLSYGNRDFHAESGTFRFANNSPSKDTTVYPFELDAHRINPLAHLSSGQLRLEYELTPHFSPSLEINSGNMSNYNDYDLSFYSTFYGKRYEAFICTFAEYSYTSLLLGLNWKSVSPSFANKHIIELGIAAGPALAQVNLENRYNQNSNIPYQFKTLTWTCKVHAAYDYFYTENFSIGVFIAYQYLRASFPGATFFNEKQEFWPEDDYRVVSFILPTEFTIPGHNIQLGGMAYGLRVGLRF